MVEHPEAFEEGHSQEVAHFDWAGPEVLQWMYVVCDSVLLCVGGRARCQLGPHNWDSSRPEQFLECACLRGLVWRGRTRVSPVAPTASSPANALSPRQRAGCRTPRSESSDLRVNSVWMWVLTELLCETGGRVSCGCQMYVTPCLCWVLHEVWFYCGCVNVCASHSLMSIWSFLIKVFECTI